MILNFEIKHRNDGWSLNQFTKNYFLQTYNIIQTCSKLTVSQMLKYWVKCTTDV